MTLPVLIQDIWVNIWNHTAGKSQINAMNVTLVYLYLGKQFEETFENTQWRKVKNAINATLPVLIQDIWVNIWNHTVGKSQINAMNVTLALLAQTKMQSMRLCLFWLKIFEKTFEITQWRKVK